MNARVRSHRILGGMKNFTLIHPDTMQFKENKSDLGRIIGLYQLCENRSISVYDFGLQINEDANITAIRYDEIESANIDDKHSKILEVITIEKRKVSLSGFNVGDKFNDALEFLRFIDRVISDLKKSANNSDASVPRSESDL